MFADTLRNKGVEIVYFDDLLHDVFEQRHVKETFLQEFLIESKPPIGAPVEDLIQYFLSLSTEDFVKKMIEGVPKDEIAPEKKINKYEMMTDKDPFYLDPMPSLYFTRDIAAVVGEGLMICNMYEKARTRETLLFQYAANYHQELYRPGIKRWFERSTKASFEGGDIFVFDEETLLVSVSERTSISAIQHFAKSIFSTENSFNNIIVIEIPKKRQFVHLDTVFAMIDYDKFLVHPELFNEKRSVNLQVFKRKIEGGYTVEKFNNLKETLQKFLKIDEILMISCGQGDVIDAPREQWNGAINLLVISPGVVIAYDRNYVTNQLMRENGIKVIEVPSSELSRGRGGPRCMSMPIIREQPTSEREPKNPRCLAPGIFWNSLVYLRGIRFLLSIST
ncbi:arginine deiminase [Evansella halocellulosilytica]|uniref:arginine deiminase n=1 Tax=Evansella halocellulosilytica TaxID=2011013 RepID=UPI000BB8708E|nr:arginine deiminase family protein [Evansella halocellulosilytica]